MKSRLPDSQTARLLQRTDWASTPLGPMERWPRSLRSYVSMIMEMPSPAIVFWGEAQTQIYNDGYALIMGPRHPRYFGAPYRECWPDTYPLIYPWMRKVLDAGEVIEVDRERIPVTRYGFEEDAYFTFTFSPLRDDEGRIAGILQPVFEVTDVVLAERRTALLAELAPDRDGDLVPADVLAALAHAPDDIPACALYLWDGVERRLDRLGPTQASHWAPAALATLDEAAQRARLTGSAVLLHGPHALVLPLAGAEIGSREGAIAFAINPRLHFDQKYREFLESAARQIGTSLQHSATRRAVEQHRTYLHQLFMQAPAGIALLRGPEHVFELSNPLYDALIGHRDVLGKPLRLAIPELEGQPFITILDEVYRTGVAHVGHEEVAYVRRAGQPGEELYFNYVYQPLNDAEGHTTGILVFSYEVTEQVRARRRSEALAEELRHEHRRKDEFLAMLAHELRNPLAPVASAAELLRRGGMDAPRIAKAAEIIGRQVRHLAELVDDLLDVSRVTRGLIAIHKEPQPMSAVVADAIEQVRPLMEARGHRFDVRMSPDHPVVLGDRKRLVQIVTNLLTNAAKYTPNGGEIALSMRVHESQVELRVEDNGIGVTPALQSRIFELFVQDERSKDRTAGGLGIGLALVKRLTELHGGTVACRSDGPQRGATFTVMLPLASATPRTAMPAHAGAMDVPSSAKRIVVVDDNVDASQMLALQLQSAGHEVLVQNDAREVVDNAVRFRADVGLLDIGLPHVDGNELARRLRAHPGTAGMMLIAVSGYGQPADRLQAREAGFDHYLVKPVDLARLRRMIADGASDAGAGAQRGCVSPVDGA